MDPLTILILVIACAALLWLMVKVLRFLAAVLILAATAVFTAWYSGFLQMDQLKGIFEKDFLPSLRDSAAAITDLLKPFFH